MSKAFTRESDDSSSDPIVPPALAQLPPGVKNYITSEGAARLRHDLDRLVQVERPRIAALAESEEIRRQTVALDARVHQLKWVLEQVTIVEKPAPPHDQVRFGATVVVRNSSGEEETFRIVGVHETDIERGYVSWLSPLARALLNARIGQRVRFSTPAGEEQLEIVSIVF
jgi:transcription elongation factor GreB